MKKLKNTNLDSEAEKIRTLQSKHLPEWLKTRQIIDSEFSQKQEMFCICGKLATGLHERSCRKFNQLVNKETMKKLTHLL